MHKNSFLEKLGKWFFIILIILILTYFSTRIFSFVIGPRIKIYTPLPGEIIKESTFFVKGNIQNAKYISINGKIISTNEKGDFKEELIVKAPYTLVVIEAIDKYGQRKEKTLEIGKE